MQTPQAAQQVTFDPSLAKDGEEVRLLQAVFISLLLESDASMFGKNDMPDKELLKMVNRKLSRAGGSQSHVTATVQRGAVTLSGRIAYENVRSPLVKAVSSVPGVRGVTDLLQGPSKHAGQGS